MPEIPPDEDDQIGHLAEDADLTDKELSAETGLEETSDLRGDASASLPPD